MQRSCSNDSVLPEIMCYKPAILENDIKPDLK